MKDTNKSKIVGFRPTPRLYFEMENICRELNIKKSVLIRFLLDDFINKYEKSKGYE